MKKICVIGSLNMDLVAKVARFPLPGETLLTDGISTYFGGKGGNQAIALGKLGAEVLMVGKVGDDFYGQSYRQHLSDHGVSVEGVAIEPGFATGTAFIQVDQSGENQIVISPGANDRLTPEDIDALWPCIAACDIFLFQLEIPLATTMYAMKRLKQDNKVIILDPAPATKLPDKMFAYIDYMTPNETEVKFYADHNQLYKFQLKEASNTLFRKGVGTIIAKAGEHGAYIINPLDLEHVPPYKVHVEDTTGAGDSFNAGLAYAMAQDRSLDEAVVTANAVGALSTRHVGAQSAMPTLDELHHFTNQIHQMKGQN